MTKELRDVLGAAEAATERGLPAFDHVVMARGVIRKANRRQAARMAGVGLLAAVSVGVIGTGGYLAYDHFGSVDPISPPLPSLSEAPSPVPTTTLDDIVGDGLPASAPLTSEVLAGAGQGWVLSIFDSTFRPGIDDPISGKRILYLVSPTGERYQVADLTRYSAPYVSAWDTERNVAFIVENRYVAVTVDLASGEVTHEWQFCGEGGYLRAEDRPGDEWLVRGNCSGESLDGIYNDAGTKVTEQGVVTGGEGITVIDVGDTQVRYEFEMPAAESYVAVHADGTEVVLEPVGEFVGCYPIGPALGGGLAVQCWGEGDQVTLWSLDLDGGPATEIAGTDTLADFSMQSFVPLSPEGAMFTGYVLAGDYPVLTTSHPAAAVLDDSRLVILTNGSIMGTSCYGGVGSTILVQGSGALWTFDAQSGAVVALLPIETPPGDGMWVGAAEGGAIIHP
jgi:hypothetical protein